MVEEKILKIVRHLYATTREGNVAWEKTTSRTAFQTAFPGYTVRIWLREGMEQPDAQDVVVAVYDAIGTKLEEATDVDLQKIAPEGAQVYSMMLELYDLARRQALGVEKALDTLLSTLEEQDGEVG